MSRWPAVTLLVLLLAALAVACRREEAPPPPPPPVVETPPAPPPVDPLDVALAKADIGEHRAALAALEGLLPTRSDDTSLWAALEREALAAGTAGDLLDRLSVSEAVGGQRALHFALRASLALNAGRPDAALAAAAALETEDPGAAAALRARAARAGAPLDASTLDPSRPADALVLAATAADPRRQREALVAARSVPGWRAALLRGELDLALSDLASVERETGIALADPDPRARLGALLLRLSAAEGPADVSAAAVEAATAAAAQHAGEQAAELLQRAVVADLIRSTPDPALRAARDLIAGRPPGDDPVTARFEASLAEAALAAGEAEEALEASTRALAGEMREGPRREAAWSRARAAYRLCSAPDLEEAARTLPEAEAAVVWGLVAVCEGDLATARPALKAASLPPPAAVDVAQARALAWIGQAQAVEAARQAVGLADAWGPLAARIEARLALERHARLAGQTATAASALADLERIAPTDAVRIEIYARRMCLGVPAVLPPPGPDEPPQATAWRAFAEAPPPEAGEPPAVAAWAVGRRALAAGDWITAARMIRAAMVSLPVARQGRWAPPLALDGADGPSFETDLRAALPGMGQGAEDLVLALHEWSRYRQGVRIGDRVGDDFTRGMEDARATAFRAAWTREQARSLQWLAGTGPFPREQRGQTAQALAEGGRCDRPMGTPPAVVSVRGRFPEAAVLSLHLGDQAGELLVLTADVARVVPVPDPARVRRLVAGWRAALEAGRATGQRTEAAAGDALRAATLDLAGEALSGLPHLVLAVDPDLLLFPWSTLPEQFEGRRFLADIRTVETVLRLGQTIPPGAPPSEGYKPDFYGSGAEPEETIVPPDEAEAEEAAVAGFSGSEIAYVTLPFRRGYAVAREGTDATAADYRATAGGARFVHLAGLGAAPDGGFAWATSRVPLPVLRCTPLHAQLVTLTRPVDPLQQVARARALQDAGARSVLLTLWEVPQPLRSRLLTAMYDALAQDRPPARALAEARSALRSEAAFAADLEDPSSWGAFLILGVP